MALSLTQLRANLYKIIDEIICTGNPVEIKKRGKKIRIIAVEPSHNKLARLKKHPGTIVGNPNGIVHLDWSKNWDEEKNL